MKTNPFYICLVIGCTLLLVSGCTPKAPTGSHELPGNQAKLYYARCNLKVIKNNHITWINWQAAPTFIPAGTKLRVTRKGDTATVLDQDTGTVYTLNIGNDGNVFLDKFLWTKPLDINRFSPEIRANIGRAVARIGMTKEEVYIAMGPPAWAGRNTDSMTYEQIMSANLWVYKRRRFGKNIGVAFDPFSGLVNRTEGIWR